MDFNALVLDFISPSKDISLVCLSLNTDSTPKCPP